jgi:hypothetical protein
MLAAVEQKHQVRFAGLAQLIDLQLTFVGPSFLVVPQTAVKEQQASMQVEENRGPDVKLSDSNASPNGNGHVASAGMDGVLFLHGACVHMATHMAAFTCCDHSVSMGGNAKDPFPFLAPPVVWQEPFGVWRLGGVCGLHCARAPHQHVQFEQRGGRSEIRRVASRGCTHVRWRWHLAQGMCITLTVNACGCSQSTLSSSYELKRSTGYRPNNDNHFRLCRRTVYRSRKCNPYIDPSTPSDCDRSIVCRTL